jgi:ABC-2 type transport system ATP-binding protein
MRRRLEIARGLIHKPKVLFLDEPTIGLDPQSRRVIWDLLTDLRKGAELTVSLTTHYLDEAEALCDRVAIVDKGKIVALGTPAELKSRIPGSDTLELTTANPVSDEALPGLRELGGVREIERTPRGLRVRADGGAALLPKLFEELRRSGQEVTSASISRITLEDVFIFFTGRSLREESAPSRPQAMVRRFT